MAQPLEARLTTKDIKSQAWFPHCWGGRDRQVSGADGPGSLVEDSVSKNKAERPVRWLG